MPALQNMIDAYLRGEIEPQPDQPLECGSAFFPVDMVKADESAVYCDRQRHYRVNAGALYAGPRCPAIRRAEIRARVETERQRLRGELETLFPYGGASFDGYNPERHQGAREALQAMREFSAARPPRWNVLLISSAGLGKTRLMLASHFALLEAGVASQYVTTPELRKLFRQADNFDSEVAQEARGKLDRYVYAEAVHFDDAGHIENDQRARGQFVEGLKDLLDRSRAAWAVASNRSSSEMETHPDLSGTVVSRFQLGAKVVRMSGVDFRTESAK